MNRINVCILSLVVSLSFATAAGAATVASAAKKGSAVAFAHIAPGGVGTVTAFGGKGTTSVATGGCSATQCTVVFTGKYPDDIALGNVIAVAGSDAGSYGVANYLVQVANPTTIQVTVATFTSNTVTGTGNGFNVALFIGKAP